MTLLECLKLLMNIFPEIIIIIIVILLGSLLA